MEFTEYIPLLLDCQKAELQNVTDPADISVKKVAKSGKKLFDILQLCQKVDLGRRDMCLTDWEPGMPPKSLSRISICYYNLQGVKISPKNML